MLILIDNGEIYAPAPQGCQSVLLMHDKIAAVGAVDRRALDGLGCAYDIIDAQECLIVPGLIDPHEHLLGGSGEDGFSTQTPELSLREIVTAGITTVVGCLGVDTTMKTLPGLLAKAKGLREEGLTAYIYTGGYNVPPTTLLSSVREDILFLDEVIGAGEIAIADVRSTDPQAHELARVVNDAYVGGLLSQKAGVTHFHVGDQPQRLALVRALLDQYHVLPSCLYPSHVERSEALMQEAIALTHQGVNVDMDVVEEELARWLRYFVDHGGDLAHVTVSSDAASTSPYTLFAQLRACVREHGFPLAQVWSLVTTNPAAILKLHTKGTLAPGYDADLLILRQDSLDIVAVFAKGRCLVREGRLVQKERFTAHSNRRMVVDGQTTPH